MKTKKILILILFCGLTLQSNLLFGQEPITLWTKVVGGDSTDVAYDVEELWDGGFAVVGYTKSIPVTNYDIWLLRTDSNGDTLWTRTYGGDGDEYGYSLKKTDDGGFIIGGATSSFGVGGFDFYLIKTDSLGDTLWTRTFGGMNDDICWSIDKTEDGGFVLAGEKDAWPIDADVWIVKTDSSGILIWESSFGNDIDDERAFSIKKARNGKFIVAGAQGCNGYASCEGWLISIDGVGDSLWSKIFMGNQSDWFQSVSLTSDSGYIITGYLSLGSLPDLWLLKTDSSGNEQWSQNIDYENDGDAGYSVQQTIDGGYIIAGQSSCFDCVAVAFVVRTDSVGNVLWQKLFNQPPSPEQITYVSDGTDGFQSVKQTKNGDYILVGYRRKAISTVYRSQVYLVRIASEIVPVELTSFTANVTRNAVSLNWQTATETNNSGFELQRSLTPNPSPKERGVFETIGFVPGFGTTTEPKSYSFIDENVSAGKYQYRLKQIDFDGSFEYSNTVEVEITSPTEFSLEQNYPNPFNPSTNIKYAISSRQFVTLKIFNSLGEEIETLVNEFQDAGVHSKLYILNSTLPSGVYYYQLRVYPVSGVGGFVETKKMILLR